MQDWQSKSRRLASTRLSDPDYVVAFENRGDGLSLNRSGNRVAFMQYGAQQGLGEPKVFEIHSFSWVVERQEEVSGPFDENSFVAQQKKEPDTSSDVSDNETFPGPNAGDAIYSGL
jgi:hypothetical protein